MRIPLPSPSDQALMQGLMSGAQLRSNQFRNAYLNAMGQSSLQRAAVAQQLEPAQH